MNRDLMYSYYQGDVSPRSRYLSVGDSDSNNNSKNSEKTAVCNCNRSPETISCTSCGKSFIGRKQIICQKHQNTIHLMDFSFCVFCKKKL